MSFSAVFVDSDVSHEDVKSFVTGCRQDIGITSDDKTGKFFCPILKKEVEVLDGICQETPRTCKERI